ncbi:TcdA/TcdB pore-forming domain-containing protein [Pseudomonas sp. FEN]|uniref:TcdA/TcdB pore-forming domain-containing protein n=1 Tax=Pseudomonas sp. FEN TaxID=2767468 RepID=UPI00174A3090|nr:TcdA/TcdB pore-forming domain-containing protein [Pseudomonas sp. FEN]
MNTPPAISSPPPGISPSCTTDSTPATTDNAPIQAQLLLSLKSLNAQVAALFNELPEPLPTTGEKQATTALEQIRQQRQSYLAQLQQFWTRPTGASAGQPAGQWLAQILKTQLGSEAQLRSADGTLSVDDRQLIDQVLSHSTRAQREASLPVPPKVRRPGVYDIVRQGADTSDNTPCPGAFVITSSDGAVLPGSDPDPRHFKGKTAVELHSELGRVVLYSLEYGLESFDSLKSLHTTLQARLGEKIAQRFSTGDDQHESVFARQVQALRNAQQGRVREAFVEHQTDTPQVLLERIKAAADLRDILDIDTRLSQRAQLLHYRTWRQRFKEGRVEDWKCYRAATWQVRASHLALKAASTVAGAERVQALRDSWQYANAAAMQLAALEARLHGRIDARQKQWIQAVLDYPDPATRPTLDAYPINANALGWRAPAPAPQSAAIHLISGGVLALNSADPSAPDVLLYTPNAPDGHDWAALNQLDELGQRFPEPAWTDYFSARLATLKNTSVAMPTAANAAHFQLLPMPGNVQQRLYEIQANADSDTTPRPDSHPAWRKIGSDAIPPMAPATDRRLRLLGGAPTAPTSSRLSAIASLVRLGSWNPQVMSLIPPIMTSLPDWPPGCNLVIIDSSEPGLGWSVRYGLNEDSYGYRVNPDIFTARHDVVLYRSSPDHYRVRLNGGLVDVLAGDDSFFHAVSLSLNRSHERGAFSIERLRNAAADQIEHNPRIARLATSAYLPLYTRALERYMELGVWLGDDVYRELIAILKGEPNPHGLFQPAIRYLEVTLPSHSARLRNAVDAAFNAGHEDHQLPALPAEIRQIIEAYIDAPPRPSLFLASDAPNRRALFETLLLAPSPAPDIDFLVEHSFIFDHNIRHLTLEYGATATQLRQYASQYPGAPITARRNLLRAALGRFPALLERLDILFSSPALTPPLGPGLNINQIAHLLRDPQIPTRRLRLIARCADAGIAPINMLGNADWLKSLSDDVIGRLLDYRQPLQELAEHMGFHDIRSILFPFDPSHAFWSPQQFHSPPLANARLKLLLDTPQLFNLLRQRSGRVATNMWRQLTRATYDESRIRQVLANPRTTLSSLRQLEKALQAELPVSAQGAGTSSSVQPARLRGYEVHWADQALPGPDEQGLYYATDGRTYILQAGRYYEVRRIAGKFQIVHPIRGLMGPTYEVARRSDGSWILIDIPGLGGDVRAAYPSIAEQSRIQRDAFADLGQAAQQEWQQLAPRAPLSERVPDLRTLEPIGGGYALELIGAPRQRLTLEKASPLARLSTRIRGTLNLVRQHFEFHNGQLQARPGVTHHQVIDSLTQLDGLNSLNSGFALLLLTSGKRFSWSTQLASAVQVQFYTQLAQVLLGVATDASLLARAIYLGLKDAGHLDSETLDLLDKAGRGITLGGNTLTLRGLLAAGNALLVLASLGVDSYLLAHAETAEDKAIYGSNVGLDSLALGMVLAGFAEGAEFLGPLSIPLAGLGLGASSLVSVFFAKAHQVLATGEQFNREIQAYRSGYVEDPESHALRTDGPLVVSHLDQRNGQVYLGSPKIYAVDNSRSGDPRVILDEHEAIDVGRLLELPTQMPLPVSNTLGALHLPVTPEHTYLPQYGWLLGATQRNDAELQLFKALEQKTQGKFIESEWVAVFQKVVEKLQPRYHLTRIRVSLGQKAPPLVMDDPGEQAEYLNYDIEGQGSRYDLYLSDGPRVHLSSCTTSPPSTWVLHTDNLSRPDDIEFETGRLTLGGVVLQVRGKQTLYTVNKAGEAYRLDLAGGRRTLVTLSARDYEDVSTLLQHLRGLREQRRLDLPLHIEDLWLAEYPGRGIYYRPVDGSLVAIPVDGEDHGEERYQIPVQPEALIITPSVQREKLREAAATLATITIYLNAQYRTFAGRSAGFWSARPAEGLPDNEKFYGDFLRAQYRLAVQRTRLHGDYSDAACQMLLQLLPGHERERPAQGPRQVPVHRLNINGYPSDDVLILGDPRQGPLLLYVPESTPALTEFNGISGLKAGVQQLAADEATCKMLQAHFPPRHRASDHSALWGYTGTDEALEKLGDDGDWSLIQIDRSPIIDEDVFAALASLKRKSEGG